MLQLDSSLNLGGACKESTLEGPGKGLYTTYVSLRVPMSSLLPPTSIPIPTIPVPEPVPALIACEVTATGCVMLQGGKLGVEKRSGKPKGFVFGRVAQMACQECWRCSWPLQEKNMVCRHRGWSICG